MKTEKLVKKIQMLSLNIAGGRVESLRKNIEEETSLRVYENGLIGVAGQIGKCDDDALKQRAVRQLAREIPYPASLTGGVRETDERKPLIPERAYVQTLSKLIEKLNREFPGFTFSNKINQIEEEQVYENSEGARLRYLGNALSFGVVIKDKASANIMDIIFSTGEADYDEEKIVSDVRQMITAYQNVLSLPKESLPVILPPNMVSIPAHELIAETYMSGAGLLSGKLGNKIFSERFSLSVDRSPENKCTSFFDDEGVFTESRRFSLVENGTFKALLTNKRSAAQYNLPLSSSAFSGFDSVPVTAGAGLSIAVTDEKLSALTERGIYCAIASGGDMTPGGDLGLPVQLAYLYENGKLVGRLPELIVSGSLFKLFGENYMGTARSAFFAYDRSPLTVLKADVRANE